MDFGHVVFVAVCVTWSCVNARWSGSLSASYQYPPHYGRIDAGLNYHPNDRLTLSGSGWVDTTGQYGVGLGLSYRFRKRAAEMTTDRFYLRIEASPCQFFVYDGNADGVLTYEEIHSVFPDAHLASRLFLDLDTTSGDRVITRDEFYFMAPKLINGCDHIVPPPILPEDQPNATESSEPDERSNSQEHATVDEEGK